LVVVAVPQGAVEDVERRHGFSTDLNFMRFGAKDSLLVFAFGQEILE
jgi:hypothetical protein